MIKTATLLFVVLGALTLGAQSKILHLDFEDPAPKRDATNHFPVSVHGNPAQTEGLFGKAFRFDGANDGIEVLTFRNEKLRFSAEQSFTVEYYFRAERKEAEGWINQSCIGNMTFCGRPKINSPFFWIHTNKRLCTFGSGTGDYNDGRWHHIAFVRDAKAKEFCYYLDGKLIGKAAETPETEKVFAADKVVFVGFGPVFNRGYFKGCIDEYIIWDCAKKNFELKALQKQHPAQPPVKIDPGVSAAWDFLNKNELDLSPCPKEFVPGKFSFSFRPEEWRMERKQTSDQPGFEAFLQRLGECGIRGGFSEDAPNRIIAGLWDDVKSELKKKAGKPIRQGYVLEVSPEKIVIAGSDEDGLRYGWLTLCGLLRENGSMQSAQIRDWPSFEARSGWTFPWIFAEWALKQMVDEAFRARINIIEYTSIRPIAGEKIPDHFAKVADYALQRGIRMLYTTCPAVEDIPDWQKKIPAGYDAHYYPYKTGEGMHGWMGFGLSWSRDDLVAKRAAEIAEFCRKHKFSIVSFHPVDAGGVDNPANWGYRTELDRKKWGDDFTSAQIHLINTYADHIRKLAPEIGFVYVAYPYSPRLLLTPPFPEHIRRVASELRPDIKLLRRESVIKDIRELDKVTGPGHFFTSFYPFFYDLLPLYTNAGRYMATFYENERSWVGLEVWAPCGICGDAYKYTAAEYMWNPFAPGAEYLPPNHLERLDVQRESSPVLEGELLPRICSILYGRKAAPVMAEFFAAKLSERYAEHPAVLLGINVDQEKFFADQIELAGNLLKKMERVQKDVKPAILPFFKLRKDYARNVMNVSKVRLACIRAERMIAEKRYEDAEKEAAAGREILNTAPGIRNTRAYKYLVKDIQIQNRIKGVGERLAYVDSLPEMRLNVAFYNYSGTGGDISSKMLLGMAASLNRVGGLKVSMISDLSKANLAQTDVLIFNAVNNIGDCTEDWRKNLRDFVVEQGKTILFLHNAVGKGGAYKLGTHRSNLYPTLFPEICKGAVDRKPKISEFRIEDDRMFLPFRKKGEIYHQAYYDHYRLEPGPAGKIIVRDAEGAPVAVCGKVGKGKVVYSGEVFGINSKDEFVQPELENWKMLLHLIRFAGSR